MSLEVKVPVVGESISEVTIAKWLKKDGDQVAMDEIICDIAFNIPHPRSAVALYRRLSHRSNRALAPQPRHANARL